MTSSLMLRLDLWISQYHISSSNDGIWLFDWIKSSKKLIYDTSKYVISPYEAVSISEPFQGIFREDVLGVTLRVIALNFSVFLCHRKV